MMFCAVVLILDCIVYRTMIDYIFYIELNLYSNAKSRCVYVNKSMVHPVPG